MLVLEVVLLRFLPGYCPPSVCFVRIVGALMSSAVFMAVCHWRVKMSFVKAYRPSSGSVQSRPPRRVNERYGSARR